MKINFIAITYLYRSLIQEIEDNFTKQKRQTCISTFSYSNEKTKADIDLSLVLSIINISLKIRDIQFKFNIIKIFSLIKNYEIPIKTIQFQQV